MIVGGCALWMKRRPPNFFRLYFFQLAFQVMLSLVAVLMQPELPFQSLIVPALLAMNMPIIGLIIVWLFKLEIEALNQRLASVNAVAFFQSFIIFTLLVGGHLVDPLGRAPVYLLAFYLLPWLSFPLWGLVFQNRPAPERPI